MKNIIITLIFCLFFVPIVVAATPTATPSSTLEASPSSKIDKQIENLKEKIANKVAEINKKDKRAYAGIITAIDSSTIFFKSNDDQDLEAKLDEVISKIYIISGSTQKEAKLSDLEKGDFIIVSGVSSGKSITVNSVYKDEKFYVKTGKISEVNKTDYYIKVTTSDKENMIVDIETITKIKILNIKTLEVERSGFSKMKEGDTIHFVYKKPVETKEQNRYSAQTILIIPQEYFIK